MPWNELDWTQVGAGLVFIILVIVQALRGFFGGRRSSAPEAAVEVAGALIDSKRIDGLIAALNMNTMALKQNQAAVDKNTAECEELREEARRHGHTMQRLGDALYQTRGHH